jgi:hypothetical protein
MISTRGIIPTQGPSPFGGVTSTRNVANDNGESARDSHKPAGAASTRQAAISWQPIADRNVRAALGAGSDIEKPAAFGRLTKGMFSRAESVCA